jgi:hypothetical protein
MKDELESMRVIMYFVSNTVATLVKYLYCYNLGLMTPLQCVTANCHPHLIDALYCLVMRHRIGSYRVDVL